MSGQPYLDFAQKHFDIINLSGDEAMVRCIVHDDSKASMQFNVRSGLWTCFACGEGGSIKRACRELGVSVLADPEPELDDIYAKLRELSRPSRKGQPDVLDESVLKRYNFPTKYWKSRGFTEETIRAFDLGYDIMNEAVTIPVRNENGALVGVIRRYLDEDVDLRYKYPKGFKRSMNMFGSWLVENDPGDLVCLVEGSVDAMMCWQAGIPALAVFGSSISPTQVRLLRRLGVGQVVLFFDNDKAGKKAALGCLGQKQRIRKGKTWFDYDPRTDLRRWFLVSQVDYQQNWAPDPGAMKEKHIRKAVKAARLLNLTQ